VNVETSFACPSLLIMSLYLGADMMLRMGDMLLCMGRMYR
jgi:hypothetical protein